MCNYCLLVRILLYVVRNTQHATLHVFHYPSMSRLHLTLMQCVLDVLRPVIKNNNYNNKITYK